VNNPPRREQYLYQPKYCEENIWQLCNRPQFQESEVVVLASVGDFFPLLCQRAAEAPDVPVFWDYHVVLLWRHGDGEHYILDFDTTLPFCTPAETYFSRSLLDENLLRHEYIPRFRLLSAIDYVATLKSDRSHMRSEAGWLAEPPEWPPICSNETNLSKFTDMNDDEFGQILTRSQLITRLI